MQHVPNLLSAARILLAPYIIYLLSERDYQAALIWFAIAGASDAADGWIARRFHASSRLGAYLDPIGDKLLLSGAFVALAATGVIPVWLAVIVLGRDVLILLFAAGVLLFTTRRRDFPPSVWGKISTLFQIGYVLAAVAGAAGLAPPTVTTILQWITVLFTAISAVAYGVSGFTYLRQPPRQAPNQAPHTAGTARLRG